MDQARTITVDGVAYPVDQFSQAVQQAVTIYNTFQEDLQKSQLEVIKNQSALQSVGTQIGEAVKKELADQAATAAGAPVDAPVGDTPVAAPVDTPVAATVDATVVAPAA